MCDSGDGGGGDGSSGSEESGNDGGVLTIPPPTANVQTTYDVLRGLGIVGSSAVGEYEDGDLNTEVRTATSQLTLLALFNFTHWKSILLRSSKSQHRMLRCVAPGSYCVIVEEEVDFTRVRWS